jgi:molybdenum cofactor biosynthesis enzyme
MPLSDLTAQLAETLTARIEALVLDAIALDGPVVDTARLNRVTDAKTGSETFLLDACPVIQIAPASLALERTGHGFRIIAVIECRRFDR